MPTKDRRLLSAIGEHANHVRWGNTAQAERAAKELQALVLEGHIKKANEVGLTAQQRSRLAALLSGGSDGE